MADGSLKLLSPLPAWLTPGRAHVLLMVTGAGASTKPKRMKPTATPEMIQRRMEALKRVR